MILVEYVERAIGNGVCGWVQLCPVSRLFVKDSRSFTLVTSNEYSEMVIINGVLPFIAATNARVDDCIAYWYI